MKKYAMERGFLNRLRSDRRDLLEFARAVGTAAEMRAAREELIASAMVFTTPKPGEAVSLTIRDGVAFIPVVGELTPHAKTDACGAYTASALTEYGFIQEALIAAEDNPEVKEIALDMDSPGGYINGLDETAQLLGAVSKPTITYVRGMAASAAYWLASQTDRIVAMSPASEIGSIGIALEEFDDDAALANEGISHRVYTSTDAPDKRPDTKTEEGQAKVIAELDALHGIFVRRVAEGRGVSLEVVKESFGKGGLLLGEKAAVVGMIDEVRGSHIGRRGELSEKDGKAALVEGVKAKGPNNIEEVNKNMTDQELNALKAGAYQDGIEAERKRVAGLSAWRGINGASDKIVDEAIAAGKNYEDVSAQLAAAVAKGSARADGENPPIVASDVAETASGADGLDDVDREAMNMFGLTAADMRQYGKKE